MTEQHLQERQRLDAIIKQMVQTDCEYFNHIDLSGGLNLAYRIVKHIHGDGPLPSNLHRGLIEASHIAREYEAPADGPGAC